MTYRSRAGRLVEDAVAIRTASAASKRATARFRTWQSLDSERRLQAVDEALKAPANDLIDEYPLAL